MRNLILKVGHIISSWQKNHQRTHLCTVCPINLLLQCFSVQHPHCWQMVGPKPTLRRYTSKIYYHLLFLLVLVAQRWNRKWMSLMSFAFNYTWSFLVSIHGRSNNFSDESHLQQANVIQERCNDMQVNCSWRPTGTTTVNSVNDWPWKNQSEKNDHLNANTRGLLKNISTSCRAIGHTEEAPKYARRCCLTMLNHYGLNSQFLSTTPDDECSFRVKLYCTPKNWVSSWFFFALISCLENKKPLRLTCEVISYFIPN